MVKMKTRGFTLIELLVVIAIIGILSSVVLASLNTARQKGQIAAIKSSMQSVRVQAELYYDDHSSSYGTPVAVANSCGAAANMFGNDTTIAQAITEIEGIESTVVRCAIGQDGQSWALEKTLPDNSTWCTDSTGQAISGTAGGGGDSADAVCS
jgi:prepilin-type N-terminal cleavage/methylation domain-containing protein